MAMLLFSLLFVLAAATLLLIRFRTSTSGQSIPALAPFREKAGLDNGGDGSITPLTTPEEDGPGDIKIEALFDFDWTKVEPEKHRPFKPTYHITMALKNTPPSDLIQIDKNYLERITYRRNILRDHEATVIGYIPEGIPAIYEVYSYLLGTYLPTRFPTMFSLQTSGSGTNFHNAVTSQTWPVSPPPADPLDALRILAQTIEDDFFLLKLQPPSSERFPGEHMAIAFICLHPAGFDPSTKLGQGLKAIHVPVPSYNKIGPSMERFFVRTTVDKPVKRLNWSVQTHTNLFSPGMNHVHLQEGEDALEKVERDVEVEIESARLRVELQTLSRLRETGALMFSFKTYLYGLDEVKREGLGAELADAVEGLGKGNAPGMWVYKGGIKWGKKVCEYLRS